MLTHSLVVYFINPNKGSVVYFVSNVLVTNQKHKIHTKPQSHVVFYTLYFFCLICCKTLSALSFLTQVLRSLGNEQHICYNNILLAVRLLLCLYLIKHINLKQLFPTD